MYPDESLFEARLVRTLKRSQRGSGEVTRYAPPNAMEYMGNDDMVHMRGIREMQAKRHGREYHCRSTGMLRVPLGFSDVLESTVKVGH